MGKEKKNSLNAVIVLKCIQVDPSVRSMMALQEERGSTSYSELQDVVAKRTSTPNAEGKSAPALKWSRIPGQVSVVYASKLRTTVQPRVFVEN